MSVFLRVLDHAGVSDVAALHPGAELRIGRGEHNDVAFPGDDQMSFNHCSLQLDGDRCLLTDLNSTNGTVIDGNRVASANLVHKDRFVCGQTEFTLEWPSAPPRPKEADSSPAAGSAGRTMPAARGKATVFAPLAGGPSDSDDLTPVTGFTGDTAAAIVARFKLGQKVRVTPEDGETPADYIGRLRDLSLSECLCFMAFALPKRCAVWWAMECVRLSTDSSDDDAELFQLAGRWLNVPTDKNRRAAMDLVTINEMETPGVWVAQALFYSHGSTTPPNCPSVPARDDLCGQTVYAGISIASVTCATDAIEERQGKFLDLGLAIAGGDHPWPPMAEASVSG